MPVRCLRPEVEARPLWPRGDRPTRKAAQRFCDLAAVATAASFALPANTEFEIEVIELLDYVCHYG